MPVQSVLVAGALVMIIACRVRLNDLMEGIILLPVTAMAAGFLAAGALAATGGFDALGVMLNSLVKVPFLGIAGCSLFLFSFRPYCPFLARGFLQLLLFRFSICSAPRNSVFSTGRNWPS